MAAEVTPSLQRQGEATDRAPLRFRQARPQLLAERIFPYRVRHQHGPRTITAAADEMVVVCLVRDGAAYIEAFLDHYRRLGARHLVFLDNGSSDATVPLLAGHSDVTVLRTTAPYKRYKDVMKRYLVRRWHGGGWALCVDIDEFFEYPAMQRTPLPQFLRYLNTHRYNAVVCQLLDMFPQGDLIGADSGDWRASHRFYDLSAVSDKEYAAYYGSVNRADDAGVKVLAGGIRLSGFGVLPLLTKHALIRPSAGARFDRAHHAVRARVADVTAVLKHYKYVGDFVRYAERIVAEKSFSVGSREYRRYLDAFRDEQGLSLHSDTAEEYADADRLVDSGFLYASARYRDQAAGG